MTAPAALGRLRDSRLPRILFVAHAFGGGVARHIEALAQAVAGDAEILLLQPHVEGYARLQWLRGGEDLAIWFRTVEDWDGATALLAAISVDRVHYHHVHGWPQSILALGRRLACPHDVTLHDYYPACPAYHLTGADGRYCGGAPDCGHCLDGGPAQWPLSIPAWRAAFRELLGSAARVIAPSRDAAERIARFFPGVVPVVWPHPEDATAAPSPAVRVLVPGAIPPAKGLDVLEACMRDAAARGLPLHFRVLGYTSRPIEAWPAFPYSVAGEYREGDLPALIALEGGDALFFPAQCPETYSYTLTAALASGLPIVATNLGAFPERLAAHRAASIVPWDAPAAAMNDAILARVAPRGRPASAAPSMTSAAYRARYLEGIVPGAPPRGKPVLDPAWLVEPAAGVEPSSLAWLFRDGVRAGRGRSLAELERRTGEADLALTLAAEERIRMRSALTDQESKARALAAERDAARAEGDRLAREASAAQERLRRLESSRSWRMTAPLRALVRRLRRG
jgi:glycosyltransferase involved in cell wall biosynthesis